MREAFQVARKLTRVVESIKDNRGTKESPARTCKDLAQAHSDYESGTYWIDPNQGSTSDAFEAYCNMKTMETCVHATPNQVPKAAWYVGPKRRMWFGEEMKNGFVFTYTTDVAQFQFLHMLSSSATQNITFLCRNMVAHYDARAKSFKKAAIFSSMDDQEIGTASRHNNQYTVPIDGCKYRKQAWSQTVFSFKTDKTTRLPIEDIAPADVGGANQGFGLDIGPVCFS